MLKSLLTGAICALSLSVCSAQAGSFALLDARFSAALPTLADKPVARAVVRDAQASLGRVPSPLPTVHTEGTLPGKGIREISLKAREDLPVTLNLAMAYRITADRRYLAATERFLTAWADIYLPSFNPIDETHFDQLMMACDLAEPDLSPAARAKLDTFWRRMAIGYLDAMDDGQLTHAVTNWQSHRVKLATMAAFRTGDPALIDRAAGAYRRQLAANIQADGSVFDFHERDALHYVTYDLDPLMMATLTARAHGQDWFAWRNPAGAGVPAALDWLAPYAKGEKVHMEFVNSKIRFDAERAASGQAEYQPHPWNAANAVSTYTLAHLLDARYAKVLDTVTIRTPNALPLWMALLALAQGG